MTEKPFLPILVPDDGAARIVLLRPEWIAFEAVLRNDVRQIVLGNAQVAGHISWGDGEKLVSLTADTLILRFRQQFEFGMRG